MGSRLQRALVAGRRARHWYYRDDCLVLRAHDGLAEVKVPTADLIDESRMEVHVARLAPWAPVGAIAELDAIVAGTRG
jgi:hypothetical protein